MNNKFYSSALIAVITLTISVKSLADDIDIFYVENIPTTCETTLTSPAGVTFEYFKEHQTAILKNTASFSNSPVSINPSNQFQHNDNVYYTMFAPSELTSWSGNLKSYKLSNNGEILDKNNKVAINPTTGLFVETAQSHWSENIDGAQVSSGGVAGRLNYISRNLYVNHQSSLVKLNNMDNPALTYDDFGLSTNSVPQTNQKQDYINWMLSQTNIADSLHSSPATVHYSGLHSVIFFGDNQGYLHAIDAESGNELWAFIPKELLKNQPVVRHPSTVFLSQSQLSHNQPSETQPPKRGAHIYGMDGDIMTWIENGRTYIASGMRRGGSSYYALDVTNRLTPTLLWHISSDHADFSNLGQTWSTPIKTSIKIGNEIKSVLIFGGGYDPQQDTVTTKTNDQQGDSLYIIEAATGQVLLKQDNLGYSIPSNVKAIDLDGNNTADQIYVGDMGGRILRFDIIDSTLKHHIIADVSGNEPINNRRFYHAPDVSFLENTLQGSTAYSTLGIAIGSGYHAHPNDIQISDRFYLFKVPTTLANTITTITENDLSLAVINTENSFIVNDNGWYLPLKDQHNDHYGEKVLSSSITIDNVIWFTTFQPSMVIDQCILKHGTSRLYRVNVFNGSPNYQNVIPEILDQKVDDSKDCSNTTCGIEDRYIELQNIAIAPSPIKLTITNTKDTNKESSNVVCIGNYCIEQAKRTTKMTFWRQLN